MALKVSIKLLIVCFLSVTISERTKLNANESVKGGEMNNTRILISGAGISGLMLAHKLKESGFKPTLIENHPYLRTGGYKIDVRGVALDVLKKFDFYHEIQASTTGLKGATLIDGFKGEKKINTDADLCGGRVKGDIEIMRGDLCKILYDNLEDVECIFGSSITDIKQEAEDLTVEINHNIKRKFDLVIGADGIHSKVRELVFGNEINFLKELGCYISVFTIPNYMNLDCWEFEYFAPQKFVNIYSTYGKLNAKAGFALFTTEKNIQKLPKKKKIQFLKDKFKNEGWETKSILKHIDESDDFYFDTAAQVKMDTLSKKRVALVGDSGYAPSPLSGQGASVSIVGAHVLSRELSQAAGEYETAFSNYENRMKPFIQQNQDLVGLSVVLLGSKPSSFIAKFTQFILKWMPTSLLEYIKSLGSKRIHRAANSILIEGNLET